MKPFGIILAIVAVPVLLVWSIVYLLGDAEHRELRKMERQLEAAAGALEINETNYLILRKEYREKLGMDVIMTEYRTKEQTDSSFLD